MTRLSQQESLEQHVASLLKCRRCPQMQSTPVSGGAIVSDTMIIGQAPGPREPVLRRPFAHTAGKTLFRWFEEFCAMNEAAVRSQIYFAEVCCCFPCKNSHCIRPSVNSTINLEIRNSGNFGRTG